MALTASTDRICGPISMTHFVGTQSDTTSKHKAGRTVQPWLVSLSLHTLGILFLALWVAPNLGNARVEHIEAALVSSDVALFEYSISSAPTSPPNVSDVEATPELAVSVAAALAVKPIEFALAPDALQQNQSFNPPALPARFAPAELLPGTTLSTNRISSDLSQMRRADGVASAADIVTGAIRRELEQGDTLVVWLLDASISLHENRELLSKKAESFYKSIDAFNTSGEQYGGDHTLLSSVVSFGRSWNEIMRPTRMGAKAIEKMTEVPIDRSGIENVMAAVNGTVRLYRERRHRNDRLVLVILTDESGDDVTNLEQTIELCREEGVVVHVVGPSAVMGCQKGSQLCQIPQGNRTYPFWLIVNKGPETSLPERFLLPYWHESSVPPWQQDGATAGQSAWYGGSYRERLPSGFGPYALTRLALQTAGSFTMFEPLPSEANYQHDRLLDYAPDYGSYQDYLASLQGRPLRQLVADAAKTSFEQPQLFIVPRLAFMGGRSPYYPYEVEHHYYSPADFRDQLSVSLNRERTQVARAVQLLSKYVAHLDDPAIDWEYEYTKEESKRWRAWYDLTKGRLLATQARYLEYLATTQEIQQVLSPTCNQVTFHAATGMRNPISQMLAKEATRVLDRCMEENAGTPWEDLARWELDKPFGLRIEQGQIPKPPPRIISVSPRAPQQFSFPNL